MRKHLLIAMAFFAFTCASAYAQLCDIVPELTFANDPSLVTTPSDKLDLDQTVEALKKICTKEGNTMSSPWGEGRIFPVLFLDRRFEKASDTDYEKVFGADDAISLANRIEYKIFVPAKSSFRLDDATEVSFVLIGTCWNDTPNVISIFKLKAPKGDPYVVKSMPLGQAKGTFLRKKRARASLRLHTANCYSAIRTWTNMRNTPPRNK